MTKAITQDNTLADVLYSFGEHPITRLKALLNIGDIDNPTHKQRHWSTWTDRLIVLWQQPSFLPKYIPGRTFRFLSWFSHLRSETLYSGGCLGRSFFLFMDGIDYHQSDQSADRLSVGNHCNRSLSFTKSTTGRRTVGQLRPYGVDKLYRTVCGRCLHLFRFRIGLESFGSFPERIGLPCLYRHTNRN